MSLSDLPPEALLRIAEHLESTENVIALQLVVRIPQSVHLKQMLFQRKFPLVDITTAPEFPIFSNQGTICLPAAAREDLALDYPALAVVLQNIQQEREIIDLRQVEDDSDYSYDSSGYESDESSNNDDTRSVPDYLLTVAYDVCYDKSRNGLSDDFDSTGMYWHGYSRAWERRERIPNYTTLYWVGQLKEAVQDGVRLTDYDPYIYFGDVRLYITDPSTLKTFQIYETGEDFHYFAMEDSFHDNNEFAYLPVTLVPEGVQVQCVHVKASNIIYDDNVLCINFTHEGKPITSVVDYLARNLQG